MEEPTLWIYPLNRSNQGQRIIEETQYHRLPLNLVKCQESGLIFSWQINTLAIADITNDDVQIITENIR